MEERFAELKERLATINDLQRALEMLMWDQTVMMPPGGSAVRAAQVTTVYTIAHERFVSDEVGELLDELEPWQAQLDYDSDEASLIRRARHDWDKLRRVPRDLAAEMTHAYVEGYDDLDEGPGGVRLLAVPPPPPALAGAEAALRRAASTGSTSPTTSCSTTSSRA